MPKFTRSILSALTLSGLIASPSAAQDRAQNRNFELQLGPHSFSTSNPEEMLLDLSKSLNGEWQAIMEDGEGIEIYANDGAGAIEPETGLPVRLPNGAKAISGGSVLSAHRYYPEYFSDHYTFEWQGDAFGFLNRQPRNLQTRTGKNKLTFYAPIKGPSGRQVRFSQINGEGVTGLKIYRNKYKKLIEAGEIWNPVFIKYLKKYDVIRTMDMQAVNASPIRSFDDVAQLQDAFYGRGLNHNWPTSGRYGAPYEILFDLANKADIKLWTHVPIMIGAPVHLADPALRQSDKPEYVDWKKVMAMSKANSSTIIESFEWDKFAAAFVDRLIASGYPAEKPLYVELGNEIWNTAGYFALSSYYAGGIAEAINDKWGVREGYGVLSARWASALQRELDKKGREQEIIHVLASQTAWDDTTAWAIKGYKYYLEQLNDPALSKKILSNTGVALTTYSMCAESFSKSHFGNLSREEKVKAWVEAIDDDPEMLKQQLRDFCVDGPATAKAGRRWIVNKWRAHQRKAQSQGLKIIGAYEGGSHDIPDNKLMENQKFYDWWREYHWGPYGADVVRQINLSIAEAFPGVILSNYVSMGPIGRYPWVDGHYSSETDMTRMWDEFARQP